MRAHQPGSTPIDIPETVPNPAYTPAPAPAPERAPTKVPEKVPEKVISGIAEVTATSNGGLTPTPLVLSDTSNICICAFTVVAPGVRFNAFAIFLAPAFCFARDFS
jgi:hypothetical protein